MAGVVKLHRVLKTTPDKLYKAFLDPAANAKWLPPHGFTCTVQQLDAKVGGTFRMFFTNFATGQNESFSGTYKELVPGQRIVYTDKFDNPALPGEIKVTIEFKKVICGTELSIVQENIPSVIPVEMCYLGWQESLEQLAKLVEPEING